MQQPETFEICFALTVMMNFSYCASIASIFSISIERFWAVCNPFSYRMYFNGSIANILIATSWIYSLVAAATPVFDGGVRGRFQGRCTLSSILSYGMLFFNFFSTFCGSLLMTILYGYIYRAIIKQVQDFLTIQDA